MASWSRLHFLKLALFVASESGVCADKTFIDGENVVVVMSEDAAQVGRRWGRLAKEELIGGTAGIAGEIADEVVYRSPLNLTTYVANRAGNFKKTAQIIASGCRAKSNENVMTAISCLSRSVNATLKQNGWPWIFTECRAHATAFRAAFEALDIPGSWVMAVNGGTSQEEHVVNKFILSSRDGVPYSYVIDVGVKPATVYPDTDLTERWHQKEKNKFPELSFGKPNSMFRSKPKTGSGL